MQFQRKLEFRLPDFEPEEVFEQQRLGWFEDEAEMLCYVTSLPMTVEHGDTVVMLFLERHILAVVHTYGCLRVDLGVILEG